MLPLVSHASEKTASAVFFMVWYNGLGVISKHGSGMFSAPAFNNKGGDDANDCI